ncbi:MAG: hypothetical protein U1F17_02500 [Burkholderiaceae bacterium]
MLATLRFQVGLLALMQALLLTNNITLIAVNGLAGLQLADNMLFATLPVTGYVLVARSGRCRRRRSCAATAGAPATRSARSRRWAGRCSRGTR